MIKTITINYSAFLLGVIIATFSYKTIAEEFSLPSISICVPDTEAPPIITNKGTSGTFITKLKQAAKNANVNLVLIPNPRTRCLRDLTEGKVDATFLARKVPIKNLVFPLVDKNQSDEFFGVGTLNGSVYRRTADNNISWDGEKFYGDRPRGFVYWAGSPLIHEFLENAGEKRVQKARTIEQGLLMVALNRSDAALMITSVADEIISKNPDLKSKLEKTGPYFLSATIHVGYNKANYEGIRSQANSLWAALYNINSKQKVTQ